MARRAVQPDGRWAGVRSQVVVDRTERVRISSTSTALNASPKKLYNYTVVSRHLLGKPWCLCSG